MVCGENRRGKTEAAKVAFARACAAAIPCLGTTTKTAARAMLTHANIAVIPNDTNVANTLAANPAAR